MFFMGPERLRLTDQLLLVLTQAFLIALIMSRNPLTAGQIEHAW